MAEALDGALPDDIDDLALKVLQEACDRGLKLVTAESCTGGLLASLLTDIPGCSHAFERGFVTYTDAAKHELLGVDREILERDGAVSERCARAMAAGALARSEGDVALSITGYAEASPDGGPAGLVHFASARQGEPTLHQVRRFGEIGRAEVRLACLRVALGMIRERLIHRPATAA
ncbi:MAG: CinA family protein [Phenylobacterium sp.]|jgi:nicotinamide-nucleotide amidase|uniref:CinA family protein n=1 Tax=Phenylobacterium sp. TaxID=1871053 RepID=UPI00391B066D